MIHYPDPRTAPGEPPVTLCGLFSAHRRTDTRNGYVSCTYCLQMTRGIPRSEQFHTDGVWWIDFLQRNRPGDFYRWTTHGRNGHDGMKPFSWRVPNVAGCYVFTLHPVEAHR